jgi:hypothetical protein
MDRVRHQADSQSKYNLYHKLLRSKLSHCNIEPRQTYNMDKKGFMLGILTSSKRIFSKRLYEEGKIKAYIYQSRSVALTTKGYYNKAIVRGSIASCSVLVLRFRCFITLGGS